MEIKIVDMVDVSSYNSNRMKLRNITNNKKRLQGGYQVKTIVCKDYVQVLHKKTGNVYFVLSEIMNCTNINSDEDMILYTNGKELFVREREEFYEKFEEI